MVSARAVVNRGVRLLDEINPNWHRKVDLSKFDLGSPTMCVLGQVYGEFTDAIRDIAYDLVQGRLKGLRVDDVHLDDAYYGFDTAEWGYEDLGHAWQNVIAARQEADRLNRRKVARRRR